MKGKFYMLLNINKQMIGCMILLVLWAAGTSAAAVADNDELEVMRREMEQLRQQVQELKNEFRRLQDDRKKDKDVPSGYQQKIQELRDDVTKLNESHKLDISETMGKIKLGGYGDIHANFTEGSESDKGDFHRLVLYLGYDFGDWIKFHSETELEHAFVNDGDGEISLEQAHFDFLLSDNLNVRAGRILTPIGIINKTHEPPTFNGVERPNFAKYIIPTTWSSDGVGLFGSLNPSINYEAYVVAGLDGDSFSSSGIRGGRIKSEQSLNEVAFAGRLDFHPFEEVLSNSEQSLRLGLSSYLGGLDNTDGGGGSGKDGEIAMTSADFQYSISKFDFRGVIANTNIDGARNFGGGVAEEMFGWYLEGAYHFWPDEWKTGKLEKSDATVFVRYEEYDTQHEMPSGIAKDRTKDVDEVTAGVNFYLTPNFVIKADYQISDDTSGSDRDDLFNLGIGWMF
jgi:hypothetical protein